MPTSLINFKGDLFFVSNTIHNNFSYGQELWKLDNCTTFNKEVSIIGNTTYFNSQIQVSPNTVSCQCDIFNSLVSTVNAIGANPVTGEITSKVWIESSQPSNYVKRHYELNPATNPTTATAKITLYFTQEEFDAYNVVNSSSILPSNDSDNAGKSNLRIEKYTGTTVDGLPDSYGVTSAEIDPTDSDIVWNAALNRWEISFETTGFGGYFVKTNGIDLGTNDNIKRPEFAIYPNPATEEVQINLFNIDNAKLTLIDINGRILLKKNIQEQDSVNISNLPANVYFIKIDSEKGKAVKKIIKK